MMNVRMTRKILVDGTNWQWFRDHPEEWRKLHGGEIARIDKSTYLGIQKYVENVDVAASKERHSK